MACAAGSSAIPAGMVRTRALVIGFGNTLFADDGAGPLAAELIASRGIEGVHVRAVQELGPELAADIAATDEVYFIDASEHGESVSCLPLAREADGLLDHALTPAALLALAAGAFGRCPPAWLLLVPGEDFTLGHDLSGRTRLRVDEAVTLVARRL
jgi:hydrogenase maturation protease